MSQNNIIILFFVIIYLYNDLFDDVKELYTFEPIYDKQGSHKNIPIVS